MIPIKKKSFLDLFADPSPALRVKFDKLSKELASTIYVRSTLGSHIDQKGKEYIELLCKDIRLRDFLEFYIAHDGFELCTPYSPGNCQEIPLMKLIPSELLQEFNSQYIQGGEWDWTIDLNKSKALYRGNNSWIAFAQIGNGPACLTIFLDGENAGCVYLVTPQPGFNILKPIAKSFNLLLDRIVKDPAAFFRLVRSYAIVRGTDGQDYGFVSVEYLDNEEMRTDDPIRAPDIRLRENCG